MIILGFVASAAVFSSCGPSRYTAEQPVAPVYERPASPGVGYVWVDGDWYWSGGRYTYRNGYWSRPRGHRTYTTGVWVHSGKGYYWRKGHWR